MEKRLFIVTNRLPFTFGNESGLPQRPGERVTAMGDYWRKSASDRFHEVCWAGVPGCHPASWYNHISSKATGPITWLPVFTSVSEYDRHYNGICSTILQPLFRQGQTNVVPDEAFYMNYLQVNQRFADTLLKRLRPGDTLWIQDFHLLPLAALLRTAMPELTIGLSLHIAFPAVEAFSLLPRQWQTDLLHGMLGADLIDFQHGNDASHFLQNVLALLGLDHDHHVLHHDNRLIRVSVFPVIEPAPAMQDNNSWIGDFLHELAQIKQQQQDYQIRFFDDYTRRQVFDQYRLSGSRLILLDYDGTLVPFTALPEEAVPSPSLLQVLQNLAAMPGNELYIISGRSKAWLDDCFANTGINLVAEHGACYKEKDQWHTSVDSRADWKKEIRQIMDDLGQRCANTFTEEKEFSLVWHYRNAPAESGSEAANALANELQHYVQQRGLHIMMGNKIVEVKEDAINKGIFTEKLLLQRPCDFALAIGDDTTDEDMFKALLGYPGAVTIKVGAVASYARFNLHTPQTVFSFLEALQHLPQETIPNR